MLHKGRIYKFLSKYLIPHANFYVGLRYITAEFLALGHPNVRVFITHGGCLGTQEAVYNGVPMIGIPLYSDQHQNIEIYVSKNIAVKLDYYAINKESVLHAIRTILENST
jgi:UDP:flavonoid glycosyltransferase YjiC (YdhE family)